MEFVQKISHAYGRTVQYCAPLYCTVHYLLITTNLPNSAGHHNTVLYPISKRGGPAAGREGGRGSIVSCKEGREAFGERNLKKGGSRKGRKRGYI
jgi:hypothetical protein